MTKSLKLMIVAVIVSCTALPATAEMSPAGETMIAVHAAKAAKKLREKAQEEEAEKQKLGKLRERYPQDVEAYEKTLKTEPEAAKRKLAAMVSQYQKDTGEDLDKTYAVKKHEGPLQRVKERISGESETKSNADANSSSTSSGSTTTTEKHRPGLLGRLRGE